MAAICSLRVFLSLCLFPLVRVVIIKRTEEPRSGQEEELTRCCNQGDEGRRSKEGMRNGEKGVERCEKKGSLQKGERDTVRDKETVEREGRGRRGGPWICSCEERQKEKKRDKMHYHGTPTSQVCSTASCQGRTWAWFCMFAHWQVVIKTGAIALQPWSTMHALSRQHRFMDRRTIYPF